jgi:predicted RNA-binding protein with PIN domain
LKKNKSIRGGRPLYIVDGYNVILSRKVFTERRSLEEARAYLTRLIDSYASRKMIEAVVVWDGDNSRNQDKPGGARVKSVFTRGNQSADSRIVSMIERMPNRKRAIVVSDDRRHITGIVANLGAKSIRVNEFLDMLNVRSSSGGRHNRGYSEKDKRSSDDVDDPVNEKSRADDLPVNEWLRLFKSRKK